MNNNELPKEDKQLISKIDELLGQLKTISQSVFELREHASLVLPDIAPIEQVEQPKQEAFEQGYKEGWGKGYKHISMPAEQYFNQTYKETQNKQ